MKKSILFLAIGFAVTSACAQKVSEKEVPIPVKTTFTNKYPHTEVEKWTKEEDGNYEAEFDFNKEELSVVFSPSGNILETETELKVSDLPKSVSDYCAKNLAGKKIKEAAKITDAKGTVTYEAEVDNTDYIFDSNGNLLSKKVEKEDPADEDKKK